MAVLKSGSAVEVTQYCKYGDSAFQLRPWMQGLNYRHSATNDQLLFNISMSAVRASVVHSYKDLKH